MRSDGGAIVLPEGTAPKIILAGDVLIVRLLGYSEWEAFIEYPDGHRRFHRADTVNDLLGKVAGQMKLRYNVAEFQFKAIPKALTPGETITLGEIKYA